MSLKDLVVGRNDDTGAIDAGVKNAWKSKWLETKVCDVELSEFIRKIKKPGKAVCILCNQELTYGSKGRIALVNHANTADHQKKVVVTRGNYRLPGQGETIGSDCSQQPERTEIQNQPPQPPPPKPKPATSVADRVIKQEATVIAFLAENSLPFSVAPEIIKLTKHLASDRKALNELSLSRTAASYKLRFGVASVMLQETLSEIRCCPFSLNVDEAMSDNHKKVLSFLVSYFSESEKCVIVRHLRSIELKTVNSQTVY